MIRIYLAVALVWLALLPPFFTGGSCSAQFDAESDRLSRDGVRLRTSVEALRYWAERAQAVATLSVDQCRQAKPRYLPFCGSGPLLVVRVPVDGAVCRLYRDSEIRVLLQYDERDRLARIQTDMAPYKSFPIPFTDIVIHWAR